MGSAGASRLQSTDPAESFAGQEISERQLEWIWACAPGRRLYGTSTFATRALTSKTAEVEVAL
jgi:hypothetical protein